MTYLTQASLDYERVSKALSFLERNQSRQPGLKELASEVHLSEFHFQRLFQRWVGISPKRFLQFLTKEHAKELLARSHSILETAYDAGLSGPGRLHDLFVACEAVTPGEYKARGENLSIDYGFSATPFGPTLLASTERGICAIRFLTSQDGEPELRFLRQCYPHAEFHANPTRMRKLADQIFGKQTGAEPQKLLMHGTNFQLKVWEALISLPAGSLTSYQALAKTIGHPKATRAVANAVAANRIQFLIPCHRVIRKMGRFGEYQGGRIRKQAIIAWEMARSRPVR